MSYYLKALKQYADFSSRATRKDFWMFVLFNILFSIAARIVDGIIGTSGIVYGSGLIGALYFLAIFIPGLAVTVRRLHDISKSGWWILIACIPVIGWIWIFILLVTDSNTEENQYGPNPKK